MGRLLAVAAGEALLWRLQRWLQPCGSCAALPSPPSAVVLFRHCHALRGGHVLQQRQVSDANRGRLRRGQAVLRRALRLFREQPQDVSTDSVLCKRRPAHEIASRAGWPSLAAGALLNPTHHQPPPFVAQPGSAARAPPRAPLTATASPSIRSSIPRRPWPRPLTSALGLAGVGRFPALHQCCLASHPPPVPTSTIQGLIRRTSSPPSNLQV